MGGEAGRAGPSSAVRKERPLVDVLDHVLVFGQPGPRAADVPVEAAGEQDGARVDGVPASAVERDRPTQRVVGGGSEVQPAQPVGGQAAQLTDEPRRIHARIVETRRGVGHSQNRGGARPIYPGSGDGPAVARATPSGHDRCDSRTDRAHREGFMAAKYLFAANELGLFEALSDSPGGSGRAGLPYRPDPTLDPHRGDAMVALDLLERDGDEYRNTPAAAAS